MSLPEVIPSNLPVFTHKTPRSAFINSVIPQGSVLLFAQSDSNGGTRLVQKNSDGTYQETGGGAAVDIKVGYAVNTNGVITFHAVSDSLSESISVLNIVNTGVDEPGYQGGSGGGSVMNFYKCSSIDFSNSIWSGKLAFIDETTGVWNFASDSTSNLIYGAIVPQIDRVYDQACTFMLTNYKIDFPINNLIFYLPLDKYIQKNAISNYIPSSGTNISYVIYDGIPAVHLQNSCYILSSVDISNLTGNFSINMWVKPIATSRTGLLAAYDSDWQIGIDTYYDTWNIWAGNYYYQDWNILQADSPYSSDPTSSSGRGSVEVKYNTWQHISFNRSGNIWTLYVDGVLSLQKERSGTIVGTGKLAFNRWGGAEVSNHYISSDILIGKTYIYNRALTDNQRQALASQFNPVTA